MYRVLRATPQAASSESLIRNEICTAQNRKSTPKGLKLRIPIGAKRKVKRRQTSPERMASRSKSRISPMSGRIH